jgi:hypothetical protein
MGAVLSLELLLVLPILLAIILGAVELSMLMMSMQRVQAASMAACRVGTLPASNMDDQQFAMANAAEQALGSDSLVAEYDMQTDVGVYPGDPVVVALTVPMTAAAPDLLKVLGFSLEGRQLASQTQMCRQ